MKTTSTSSKSGQTTMEFALTLPLLALVLFAIIQYGLILSAYVTLRNASAVGARFAVLENTPKPSFDDIKRFTTGAVSPMLNSNLVTDVIVKTNVTVGGVSATSVEVQYDLPLIISFVVPRATSGKLSLSATTISR